MNTRVLLLLAPLLIAAAPQIVALRPQPGTPLEREARRLTAHDVRAAARAGRPALILVGTAALGPPHDRPILFVQLQSSRECGSAGCTTSAYRDVRGHWHKVLDAVSGPITVLRERHHGFHDLRVGKEHYAWTGKAYASLAPAPKGDLRDQILRGQERVRGRAGRQGMLAPIRRGEARQ